MCRNIRTLANFEPPATDEEVRAAAMQFVRKVSGSTKPSVVNEEAFDIAVDEIAASTRKLVDTLVIASPARNREEEAAKMKLRSARRFAS